MSSNVNSRLIIQADKTLMESPCLTAAERFILFHSLLRTNDFRKSNFTLHIGFAVNIPTSDGTGSFNPIVLSLEKDRGVMK